MNIKLLITFFIFIIVLGGCTSNLQPQSDMVAVPITKSSRMQLRNLATQAAYKHGIDYRLFHALIKHESAWNPKAISRKGARGLTQIMPGTGRSQCGLARDVLFNPWLNLNCGAFYFSKLLKRFKNVRLALAAYNSGETRVARLGRIPRIRETQRYVKRIMKSWQRGG